MLSCVKIEMTLQDEIKEIISVFDGTFGINIRLDGKELVNINSEKKFYAASVIKTTLAVEAYKQAIEGKITLSEMINITDDIKVGGYGVIKELSGQVKLPFKDIIKLMIIISDNTASNIVLKKVGMDNVNNTMDEYGLHNTKVQRKLRDFESKDKGVDNITTPREIAKLFETLLEKKILNYESCEELIEILKKQQDITRLPLLLPNDISVAHKPGGPFKGVNHDVGIVFTPKPYIIACMSYDDPKRVTDRVIGGDKGSQLIAKISKITYDYFTTLD